MSRKLKSAVVLFLIALLLPMPETRADNWLEYCWCVFCCGVNNPPGRARIRCIIRCKKARRAQKRKRNVSVSHTTTGYAETFGQPYVFVPPGTPITVDFDIDSTDYLESIDLYLRYDGYNPEPPEIGLPLGSDTDPTDGWSITFDTAPFGEFGGVLMAVANFPSHPPDSESDEDVIYCTTIPLEPEPPRYVDLRPNWMQLVPQPDGQVEITVDYSAIIGGLEPLPPIITDAIVYVNETPTGALPVYLEPDPGIPPCHFSTPPGCIGECFPPALDCVFVDLWFEYEEYCGCDWRGLLQGLVPASPGDRITVELDLDDMVDEAHETNNWIEGYVVPPITPGDLNCDGAIDNFDISPFVLALTDPPAYEEKYPYCNWLNADCNGDGLVDNFDISPFVHLLIGE